jgi:hypothetical protein
MDADGSAPHHGPCPLGRVESRHHAGPWHRVSLRPLVDSCSSVGRRVLAASQATVPAACMCSAWVRSSRCGCVPLWAGPICAGLHRAKPHDTVQQGRALVLAEPSKPAALCSWAARAWFQPVSLNSLSISYSIQFKFKFQKFISI